jgi:hypothetical protein
VPQIVEVEITDPGLFDRLFKTGHQLTALSPRPYGVIVGVNSCNTAIGQAKFVGSLFSLAA